MASHERFGYEWDTYHGMEPKYERQFRNWVHPLSEADFKGKSVLDAGCGMGRNSLWPLKWGAKEVVAFDLDERTVSRARQTLSGSKNATVELRSIYDLPYRNRFDVAMSIGVVHHLEDPHRAVRNLVDALRPGGRLVLWVYSYEGNEWITYLVDPVRKAFTSRLPVPLVNALAYLCSVPLWFFVKIFRGPTPYLAELATYRFGHIHGTIVLDQLIPTIANYWRKDEVEALLEGTSLTDISISAPPNRMGWTVHATKRQ